MGGKPFTTESKRMRMGSEPCWVGSCAMVAEMVPSCKNGTNFGYMPKVTILIFPLMPICLNALHAPIAPPEEQ